MSQKSQGSIGLATAMAVTIFLVAFGCLWTLGDFNLLPAWFLAAVVAIIAWIVIYVGTRPASSALAAHSESSTAQTTAAPAAAAAASVASADSDAQAAADRAEAAQAKAAADAEAAERAAAEEARRKVEQEERAEEEAQRKAAEAEQHAAEEAEKPVAASAEAESTPDYDGDGVKEGENEGKRPDGLDAPRDGKADDLKQIKGIGAKMEALCNRLGFWHFDQIAAWSKDEVAWVDANLEGFKGRVTRDAWVDQAKVLAGGGETEFSKRVEDGDVY